MHYLVMVIGEDVEGQLEPFWQDLEVEEYLVDEVSESDKERMMNFYNKYENQYTDFEKCYEENGRDWNWNAWRKDEDGVWREYSTSNPNMQWDWYQIGGRWAGKIVVKEGAEYQSPEFSWGWSEEDKKKVLKERRTDSALLKDIENVDQLSCYAIVHEGEWKDNGYDDIQGNEVQELLKTLSPDTRITFVDCHM